MAEIRMQQPQTTTTTTTTAPATAAADDADAASSSVSSDFDAAASYFLAQNRPSSSVSPSVFPPSLSSLPPSVLSFSPSFSSPASSPSISVSKYLAMRLAHHIFPEKQLKGMMEQMSDIVKDTLRTAIDAGGFYPAGHFQRGATATAVAVGDDTASSASAPTSSAAAASESDQVSSVSAVAGLSSTYFQFLGYDFLYDTHLHIPILLEVNNNVGQGLMSAEVMSKQCSDATKGECYGLSNSQYGRMREYWRTHFRQPFVEGAMRINVDGFTPNSTAAAASAAAATPTPAFPEPPRLPSSPPAASDQCWVLVDVYKRPPSSSTSAASSATAGVSAAVADRADEEDDDSSP